MATHDGIALPHRDRRRPADVPTGGAQAPGDPRYAVVAEASCAAEALAAVERLAPDAGLLDVRLGEESGHDVARCVEPARRLPRSSP